MKETDIEKPVHKCKLPNVNDFQPNTVIVCSDCGSTYRNTYFFDAEHGHWLVWYRGEL